MALRPTIVAAAALGAAVALAAACGGAGPTTAPPPAPDTGATPTTTTMAAPPTTAAAPTTTPPAPSEVTVRQLSLSPGTVTVPAGGSVVWTNEDRMLHTVTAGTPRARSDEFDRSLDGEGSAVRITFDTPGRSTTSARATRRCGARSRSQAETVSLASRSRPVRPPAPDRATGELLLVGSV